MVAVTRHQRKLQRRSKKHRGGSASDHTTDTTRSGESRRSTSEDASSNNAASKRRRSSRGTDSAMTTLASRIIRGDRVVIVTGAGLSVASGIRAFRTIPPSGHSSSSSVHTGNGGAAPAGLWNSIIWTTATRECFRKDPLAWYNEFFLPHFHTGPHRPNWGHRALQELMEEFDNVMQITQNIDALQPPTARLIEIHGRVGLYKCLNDENEDSSSEDEDSNEDDSDDDTSGKGMGPTPSEPPRKHRPRVRLGHRKQSRRAREGVESSSRCPYQFLQALDSVQVQPETTRCKLVAPFSRTRRIDAAPRCPACQRLVMPMALMFDEGYHSHTFFQFEKAEDWLESADVLVFCGTSFSVRITAVALDLARSANLEVYNFNKHDLLGASSRLNVSNVVGDLEETLPKLMRECREQMAARDEAVRLREGTSPDVKSVSVPRADSVCNVVVKDIVN